MEVSIISLEEYVNEKKIHKIDLIKIDTEGYEFEVLKGLKNKLSIVKFLIFEHHYDDMLNKGYTFRDVNVLLKNYNFKKIRKFKMPFRKSFEYIYVNEASWLNFKYIVWKNLFKMISKVESISLWKIKLP